MELVVVSAFRSWNVTVIPLNCWSESDQTAIREQLDRVLKSRPFHQSQRRQRFLEYVVGETLAGRAERLKAYTIAIEVFERPDTFDPLVDPLVRIEAGRLRDKLREYYETDGRDDAVRIDLPKGSYVPHIVLRQATLLAPEVERSEAANLDRHIDRMQAPPAPTQVWFSSKLARFNHGHRGPLIVPALGLALAMGVTGAWLYFDDRVPTLEESTTGPGLYAPTGPAIAVLPFLNLSGDPKQEYFSDGLTEDIMTELSRARDLRVLARNTTFQYKGKAVDIPKLSRELDVRYVLEGSVRRAGDGIRVTAQLIDAQTGAHVWAERFDRKMADIFLVQDEIVSQIAAKIAGGFGVIEKTEARSATRKSREEIEAYDLVLRAHDEMWAFSRETFRSAKGMLRQAIVLDPSNARARRELAWLAGLGWVFRFDETPVPPDEITAQAAKAVQLDPSDGRARMVAASAYFWAKELDLFEYEAQQAIALAPYDAEILAALGYMIASTGQWQRGVSLADRANALNAHAAAGWYHAALLFDYYLKGDYERALEMRRQHADQQARHAYIEYIPIYGQLGRKREALENWQKLLQEDRATTAESFETYYRQWNMRDEDIAKLMDGVKKSGVLGVPANKGQ